MWTCSRALWTADWAGQPSEAETTKQLGQLTALQCPTTPCDPWCDGLAPPILPVELEVLLLKEPRTEDAPR